MESVLRMALSNAVMAAGLAVVALVIGRLCRRPALTHALWLLVLLKLVTPPLWHVPVPWPREAVATGLEILTEPTPVTQVPRIDAEPTEMIFAELAAPIVVDEFAVTPDCMEPANAPPATAEVPLPSTPIPWTLVILGIWLTGSAGYVLIAALRLRRFRGLLRHACDAPAELQSKVQETARQLGLRFRPDVCMVPGPVSPMLWAFLGRPRVLLPASLWSRLSGEQRASLLAHELAHLRRRDHWTRRLELCVTALYWWNPVVWLARREISVAEEDCCDAWVVWLLPQTARDYAQALLETIDFLSETRPALPPAASGIGHVYHLRRRLAMIMRGSTPRALSRTSIVVLLVVGCLVLPFLPTWAQSQQSDKSAEIEARRAAEEALQAEYAAKAEAFSRAERLGDVLSQEDQQAAKDAVNLMHAQVEVKKAELVESEIRLKHAQQRMGSVEKLAKAGTISIEEINSAREQVEIAQAQVQQKKAQLQETMVRTEITARRTERQGNQPGKKVMKVPTEGGARLPPEKQDKDASIKEYRAALAQYQDQIKALESQLNKDASIKDYRAALAQYQDRIKLLESQLKATAEHQARQMEQVQAERARAEALMNETVKSRDKSVADKADFEKLHQALTAQQAAAEKERVRAETLYKHAQEAQRAAVGAEKTAAIQPDQARLKAVETKLDSLSKEMDAIRKDLKTLIENTKK